MDGPKLEWMYRNSSEVVDREEYLLGRPIDKAFEQSSYGNEIEKDCLPTPILSSAVSNVQVDVLRKLKEDPLEIIRQQEIERRKQLLKNPVKLKKLQNMLKEKDSQKESKRKKSKKKSKSNKSSDEDIDSLLTSKYLSLMKKHGIKSLSDLANVKVDKKKKRKKAEKHVSSSDTSGSESEDNRKHSRKSFSRRKHQESSSTSSDSDEKIAKHRRNHHESSSSSSDSDDRKTKHQQRKFRESLDEDNSKNFKEIKKKYHRSRSRSPPSKPAFKDRRPQGHNSKDFRNQKDHFRDTKHRGPGYNSRKDKISEAEKQKRLEEMMENAKWRDEVRIKNVDRYKKEEAAESKDKEYNEDFLRKQMAIATSVGTVESRIKSNINNIQRSKFSMNENFARR